jgi:hypothetical protein
LPLLRGSPTAIVHATDPSITAVRDTHQRVTAAGFGHRLSVEVPPSPTLACRDDAGMFDVVMALFTLSAIPGQV